MPFPYEKLQPESGQITAIIGGSKTLLWEIRVNYANVGYPDKNLGDVGLWLRFPMAVRSWQDLSLRQWSLPLNDHVQAALYFINWDNPVLEATLSLQHRADNIFSVEVEMVVDFYGWESADYNPNLRIQAALDIPFQSLWMQYQAGAQTIEEAKAIAGEFVDLDGYMEPSTRPLRLLGEDCADFQFLPRISLDT